MLHMAATTQIRLGTEGRAYYLRKRAAGKTHLEALRCLKRRISDAVYRQLLADARPAMAEGPIDEGEASPGGMRGVSDIQRGRPAPAHRHFGSATSRTRTTDATTAPTTPAEASPHQHLLTEGSRLDHTRIAASARHAADSENP
jgi:transposase